MGKRRKPNTETVMAKRSGEEYRIRTY